MQKRVFTKYGIIEFDFKRTKSKKISIKIKNDGSVSVTAPAVVSYFEVEAFVVSRAEWIISTSSKFKEKYLQLQNSELDKIFILGKCYQLIFVGGDKVKAFERDGVIYLFGEKDKAKRKLWLELKKFANYYLYKRFIAIKQEIGITEDIHFAMRNVKTWWGSYNITKHIVKLSFRLIARDKDAIDSVIYHEFAHLKIHNHQKEFYKVLLGFCPDYYSLKSKLKNEVYLLTDKFILGD